MREVLEPLALVSGVRTTAVISPDGVPVATLQGMQQRGDSGSVVADLDADQDLSSVAAQAAGWISEVSRAVGQLSWSEPGRLLVRGTQGSLLLQRGPGVILLVTLESGVNPELLRVPMDGAVARMQRLLRSVGDRTDAASSTGASTEPPGLHSSSATTLDGQPPATPSTLSEQAGTN